MISRHSPLPVLSPTIILSVLAPVLIVFLYSLLRTDGKTKSLPLPPGPLPVPLLGNALQIPKNNPEKIYEDWGKQYNSDVITYTAFGKRFIVLNSVRSAVDLLEKRGSIYSERLRNVILQDLIGLKSPAFEPYDETLRIQRKALNTALNPSSVPDYYPIQEKEAYALMHRTLQFPEKWRHHVRRATNSTVLTIAYGHEVTTDDDYLVAVSEGTMKVVAEAFSPSSSMINLIPAFKYLPSWILGPAYKRFISEGRKVCGESLERPFQEVMDKMDSGTFPPSYVTKLLDLKGSITGRGEVDDENLIKETAGVIFAGGSHTTMIAMFFFILAMGLYPEVRAKAQAELDAVIGHSRLATFADRESLPYLQMVITESLRWMPVTPSGVPHVVKQDDEYNGMFIPKDSVIISNIWAMFHDESMYPDPYKFWPERFDGRFPNARNPRTLAFGFNRRVCPGRHLALNSIFIQAATFLALFNVSDVRDEHGKEIKPVAACDLSSEKYNCTITPRSDEAITLLKSTVAATSM